MCPPSTACARVTSKNSWRNVGGSRSRHDEPLGHSRQPAAHAVDKQGQTLDSLLTQERDTQAAQRFLTKAIRRHGVPEKVTPDGSAANAAARQRSNEEHATALIIRNSKARTKIVAQDPQSGKRGPDLGWGSKCALEPRGRSPVVNSGTC